MSKLKYLALLIIPTGLLLNFFNKPVSDHIHSPTNDSSYLNYNKSLNSLFEGKTDKSKISLLTEKSKYKLTVFYETEPIKSYPVVFGFNPVDDKLKEGDGCTPEGKFKVKAHYVHKKWDKFIWLNYPTIESWKKYGDAKSKGILKFSDSIGSKIGIHGVPDNDNSLIEQKKNWTDGNISLKNNDIDEIYEFIKDGITVEIIK